jgi:uncharacterized protein YbbC (DUF1343 family)
MRDMLKTGLERFATQADLVGRVKKQRVGLLAHPASVTCGLRHATTVLGQLGIAPRMLFGPEHGFAGQAQDMAAVFDNADAEVLVRSLYGSTFEQLSPTQEDLAKIDLLMIDLQDVGSRYYTFVWTALLALRACVRAKVKVIVLDRPNPIGADVESLEGRLPESQFLSFVGLEPLPARHALTLGEVVALFAARESVDKDLLQIVAVKNVDRSAHASEWQRPFVLPSPNMPTYEAALVYPGGCLLEGTNLSEGRGTTRPFTMFGAPWLDGEKLARAFAALRYPGAIVRALRFEPTFHKYGGQACGGVEVHVTDRNMFRPMKTYLALIALAHAHHPDQFRFRTERYEYVDDIPAFDLLTGSAFAREAIVRGEAPDAVANAVSDVGEAERAVHSEAMEALGHYAV